MNFKTRLLSSGALLSVVLAIPAMSPMAAHAAGPAAVVFSAPAQVDPPGVTAVANGIGGSGTYHFNSNGGACVGASANGVDAACNINSPSGHFTNIVCGTGSASDTAQITSTAGNYTIAYQITFVAGVGVIQNTSGPTSAGVVLIAPTAGNCVTTNVTQFQATGVAVTTG